MTPVGRRTAPSSSSSRTTRGQPGRPVRRGCGITSPTADHVRVWPGVPEAGAATASRPRRRRILFTATGAWSMARAVDGPDRRWQAGAVRSRTPRTAPAHRMGHDRLSPDPPRESASSWWRRRRSGSPTPTGRGGGGWWPPAAGTTRRPSPGAHPLVWLPDVPDLACVCGGGVFHGYPNGSVRVFGAIPGDRGSPGRGSSPAALDKGTLIVSYFMAALPEPQALGLADVSFVDLGPGRRRACPRASARSPVSPTSMSPDGANLAFDDGEAIFVANVDGSHIHSFAPQGWCVCPRLVARWDDDRVQRESLGLPPRHRHRDITRVIQERRETLVAQLQRRRQTILTRRSETPTHPAHRAVDRGPSTFLSTGAFEHIPRTQTTIAYRRTDFDGSDLTEMTSNNLAVDADGTHAHPVGPSVCSISRWTRKLCGRCRRRTARRSRCRRSTCAPSSSSTSVSVEQRSVGEGADCGWLDDHHVDHRRVQYPAA